MKRLILVLAGAFMLANMAAIAAEKPKSIIHVVTLYWKDGTTDAQKTAVLEGVDKMGREIPGITRVWLKSVKVQGAYAQKMPDGQIKSIPFTDAFVMEFRDQAAFDAYANHPAHKEWESIYVPVRGRSSTHDITN